MHVLQSSCRPPAGMLCWAEVPFSKGCLCSTLGAGRTTATPPAQQVASIASVGAPVACHCSHAPRTADPAAAFMRSVPFPAPQARCGGWTRA